MIDRLVKRKVRELEQLKKLKDLGVKVRPRESDAK